MDQTGLLYVIGFGIATSVFVFATILFSWLITHRRRRPQKGLPYECGIDTIGDTWSRFGLAFYLYALLFVAFDVEIVFVYLWAITVRVIAVQGIVLIGLFLVILLFGELYAWRKGDLTWR
ncbi:MAG: NADH-quinone oxidoreductase subunit A [Chloroflexota bacterium]|nr:NADH-quinone oxidoreductase subunit A [Chloroflexota bacterium]